MTRPANDFPAMPAPVVPTAAEPAKNAGRTAPVEHNAQPVIYSGQHKDVVPPTPILPRRLAGYAQSPGVRSDTLVIAVVVDEQGRAQSVSAVNRPQNVAEAMLLTSALAAVKQWEFDPALKDGVPVRYRLIVPLGKVTGSVP
jgi:Gram-negative bacterial TonB protein C-terminal